MDVEKKSVVNSDVKVKKKKFSPFIKKDKIAFQNIWRGYEEESRKQS